MSTESSSSHASTDVAIVGMAAHLPGAPDVRAYWRNLAAGVESMRDLSEEELAAAGVSPALYQRSNYVRRTVELEGMEHFDAGFFGFSPKDAAITDPQHRHFLEVCWEALEDAGHDPARFGRPIAVFAGSGMTAYMSFNLLTNRELVDEVGLFLLRHTGNDKDFLATRVSYELDLTGPSVNVQTACSTSLVAVHLAVQSLLSGECDMALAGGVTILLPHRRGYLYHENEILSPDGRCRPFDEASKGTVFGSGAGVVVLRRLADALAEGDHVYAVIKGSAINNDGAGKVGYLAPSVDGQARCVAEALSVAGVDPDGIDYVEAHGTATPVGDPIEVAALTQAFRGGTQRSGYCGIGSVKSNIGHLDTAAGVASLIKVALALEREALPPSLHFRAPNPAIDFAHSPFFVNASLRPWARGARPRRATVNSLGVGGTNAHAVIEEAPPRRQAPARRPVQLLCLSARSPAALDAASRRLAEHLAEHPALELADVAWTLQTGRRAFAHRRSFAARDAREARALLEGLPRERVHGAEASAEGAPIVFLLPGGGAQYLGMGRGLHEHEPVYRAELERCLALLEPELAGRLRRLLLGEPGTAEERQAWRRELERPSVQLPALFATEYALARTWLSLGLEPAALVGHSMGENTAACLAGVMSLQDALGLVVLRGRLFEQVQPGGMLSVGLAPERLEPLLGPELALAVVNAPELCVASGPRAAVDALQAELGAREIDCTRIHIDIAAHSALLEPILPAFRDYLRRIRLEPPRIPFASNRSGEWIRPEEATDPEYWVRHLRGTVRFSDCLRTVLAEGPQLFLEVGPGNTLSSLTRLHGDLALGRRVFNSLRHHDEVADDLEFALGVLGKLWCAGARPDWSALHAEERRLRVPLPPYPFERKKYWIEPGRALAEAAAARSLERQADLAQWFHVPLFQPAELPPAKPSSEALRWLLFVDEGGLGEALAIELCARGQRVLRVRAGERFERASEDELFLAPTEREDYAALVEHLAERGELPQRIVHLWMVTESEDTAVTTTFFHWVQEHGFYSLLFLGQALAGASLAAPLHLAVISNGMQQVASEGLRHPVKACVLGPCKVMPREIANLSCSSVDIEWGGAGRSNGGRERALVAEVVRQLAEELAEPRPGALAAWRSGRRYERSLAPSPLPALAPGRVVARDGATYLLTGGLGGIGLTIAERLARDAKVKLALLGRSAPPPRAEWSRWLATHGEADPTSKRLRKLMELETLGAELELGAADVANLVELRAFLERVRARFGPIHGIVHAAGVVEDGVLPTKTPASVDRVFTPKVQGTLLLDELCSGDPLDFFVLFSSTSAWLGPAGQIDYAAANAFLDAFATSRSARPGAHTVAIGWGVWSEVGMAARMIEPAAPPGREPSAREAHEHPLLGRPLVRDEREIAWLAHYGPRTHWVLAEHRLADGTALVPGTCYLELVRAALAGEGPIELQGVSFVAPLAVPDERERAVLVRLLREEQAWSFEVASRDSDAPADAEWQTHAQGRARALRSPPHEPLDLEAVAARCGRKDGAALERQRRELRFGPRWDVLRELRLGEDEALARLELPEPWRADLAQHPLHPALMDLATGFALGLIEEGRDEERAFWAPLSYRSVKVHGALPARVVSRARLCPRRPGSSDIALFDLTIASEQGEPLVEIEEFALRRFEGSAALSARIAAPPASRRVRAAEGGGLAHVDETLERLVEQGIRPQEGAEAFERVLASGRTGPITVSSIDPGALVAALDAHSARESEGPGARFARPELATGYVAPRDELEAKLAELWQELLGVERVGVEDDFFALGGYSLIAVRLFARVKKLWKLDYPLSLLFEAPSVAALAARMREELGSAAPAGAPPSAPKRKKMRHLVALHATSSGSRPPFFLVAGMYGNVMNLRHLAGHLGADQPVYGIQARGLEGDDAPHESFEEMARDYLAEVRELQPQGPYLIGGYSGGGIAAYEMARQLTQAGAEVALLVFLDTPTPTEPPLTLPKRLRLAQQRLARQGTAYFAAALRRKLDDKRRQMRLLVSKPLARLRPGEYRTERIETAFYAALERYELRPWRGRVALFRPPQQEAFVLGPGHVINEQGSWVEPLNGWGPWIEGEIDLQVVTGDHDNMVLEPHVRVLAARMRAAFDAALAGAPRGAERAGALAR